MCVVSRLIVHIRRIVGITCVLLSISLGIVADPTGGKPPSPSKISPSGCCNGITGNIDGDPQGIVDISDLMYLIDYLFLK